MKINNLLLKQSTISLKTNFSHTDTNQAKGMIKFEHHSLFSKHQSILGGLIALFTLMLYFYFFGIINKGVSVDEGYYLQGYVQHTSLSGVSDFHNIVKSVFGFLNFENALSLRYFYVLFSLAVFSLFAIVSYKFFTTRNIKANKFLFFSLMFACWILAYCFSSPLLYYDTLQVLVYLLVFSCLFFVEMHETQRFLYCFLIGFLLLFAITNYLPSGLLLLAIVIIWLFINRKFTFRNTGSLVLGLSVSIIVYSIFITPIHEYVKHAFSSLLEAQSGFTGHDSGGLLTKLIEFSLYSLLVFGVSLAVFAFTLRLSGKINDRLLINLLNVLLLGIIVVFSFLMRTKLGVILFTIPFAYLIINALKPIKENKSFLSKRNIVFILILVCTPVFGVFGTNQSIAHKVFFFLVFWMLAYFFVYFTFSEKFSLYQKIMMPTLFFIQIVILFSYYGYYKRYHNYYGVKGSAYILTDTPRLKNIQLSKHQKDFTEKLNRILKANGFNTGNNILGFEVDLLPIYAVGGKVSPDNIFYSHINMMRNNANIPHEKVKYIMLYKRAENDFIQFMKQSSWNFPASYHRVEIGKFSENMTEGQSTMLYIAK